MQWSFNNSSSFINFRGLKRRKNLADAKVQRVLNLHWDETRHTAPKSLRSLDLQERAYRTVRHFPEHQRSRQVYLQFVLFFLLLVWQVRLVLPVSASSFSFLHLLNPKTQLARLFMVENVYVEVPHSSHLLRKKIQQLLVASRQRKNWQHQKVTEQPPGHFVLAFLHIRLTWIALAFSSVSLDLNHRTSVSVL